ARLCLFEAVSVDGSRHVELRDPDYANGDRFSERHQMDHPTCARTTAGQIVAAYFAGRSPISASARFQFAADHPEQYIRAKSYFRSAQRFVFTHSTAVVALVRQSRHGRSDDARDRGRELGRAGPDRWN